MHSLSNLILLMSVLTLQTINDTFFEKNFKSTIQIFTEYVVQTETTTFQFHI